MSAWPRSASIPASSISALSGLKASLHRGLDQALRFGGVHPLAEEIGIATEVVGRREGDRVDRAP